MKYIFYFLVSVNIMPASAQAKNIFVGSTPAHPVVRSFLGIPKGDSIDFIRWHLTLDADRYTLACRYGISKPGTPGFIDEKRVQLNGTFSKEKTSYSLQHHQARLQLLLVNENLLHLMDGDRQMLVGNGGYSYALNNIDPLISSGFSVAAKQNAQPYPLVFEGRTPCQELSSILALNKRAACNKMKWYLLLYADSATGKPTYYLKGGIGYRKETMERGVWEIKAANDGRIIYQLTPENKAYTVQLLKGDDNILFFIRPDGSLLVGNEDFSYTLNRREKEYDRLK